MPEGKITNVRKRCARKSEAHFKKPKRNYRQSNEDQIQPGSHKEESSHNSKESGQPQYHHQESKTDSRFAKEKTNFRKKNKDQTHPGSQKEESSHNSKESGQPQYHHQESKTDSRFAKE